MTNAQHSSASNEHYTPKDIVEAARLTMGKIDLDPATTHFVNTETVRARHIFTEETNGLAHDWFGCVFLNPPGGITEDRKSRQLLWWNKLIHEYLYGHIEQAIFVGFSLEIFQSSQATDLSIVELPFCVPKKRVRFLKRIEDKLESGKSPTHANVIAYLPALNNAKDGGRSEALAMLRFRGAFGGIGLVRT